MNLVSYQVDDTSTADMPVTPLPNPGEGGPIPTFPSNDVPAAPGEGPITPPTPSVPTQPSVPAQPSVPSRPVGILDTIITVFPRPIIPCFFCNSNQFGTVRFLNASAGYNPFSVYINNQLTVSSLSGAEISQYGRVSSGYQTVTVSGNNGYVYIQKEIYVRSGQAMTIAIINQRNGLDLLEIPDTACDAGSNAGCFRTANLSVTNQNLDITLNSGYLNYQNIQYMDVTNFTFLPSGTYTARVFNSPAIMGSALVTSTFFIRPGTSYTLYIFNWNLSPDAIQTFLVEDRR